MTPLEIVIWLGIVAGAATSWAIIWTKIIKPLGRFLKRVVEVHEIITEFPAWQDSVDEALLKLPNIEEMLEKHIGDRGLHRS